jgi:hypothetical protein
MIIPPFGRDTQANADFQIRGKPTEMSTTISAAVSLRLLGSRGL